MKNITDIAIVGGPVLIGSIYLVLLYRANRKADAERNSHPLYQRLTVRAVFEGFPVRVAVYDEFMVVSGWQARVIPWNSILTFSTKDRFGYVHFQISYVDPTEHTVKDTYFLLSNPDALLKILQEFVPTQVLDAQ